MTQQNMQFNLSFTYNFSSKETEILAKFIRNNTLPVGLEKFAKTVENTVYSAMTVKQLENFYERRGTNC